MRLNGSEKKVSHNRLNHKVDKTHRLFSQETTFLIVELRESIEVALVLSDESRLLEEFVNVVHSRLFDKFVDISIKLLFRFTA